MQRRAKFKILSKGTARVYELERHFYGLINKTKCLSLDTNFFSGYIDFSNLLHAVESFCSFLFFVFFNYIWHYRRINNILHFVTFCRRQMSRFDKCPTIGRHLGKKVLRIQRQLLLSRKCVRFRKKVDLASCPMTLITMKIFPELYRRENDTRKNV